MALKDGDFVLFSVFPAFKNKIGKYHKEGVEILDPEIRLDFAKANVGTVSTLDRCAEVLRFEPHYVLGVWAASTKTGTWFAPMLALAKGIDPNSGMLIFKEQEILI